MPAAPETMPTITQTASQEVDARTLREWLDADSALVVDVREPEEFAREHIPGARLIPLSAFEPSRIPAGAMVVLHCRSGRRSAEAAARLASTGRCDVLQLKGGIEAWKAAGLPVEENPRVPISIIRQVQLVVGTLVLATSILAALVSPWFLLLTGFFGAGLVFAGATGTCGMASALALMPWNRAFVALPSKTKEKPVSASGCCGGACKE